TGEFAGDAAALADRLSQALQADELATPLVDRLRDSVQAATDLLTRAAREPRATPAAVAPSAASTTEPAPAPQPADATEPAASFDRKVAEARLQEIRERLRAEARLDLIWEIKELPDADG